MFHEDTTRVEEISKKRGISMAQVSLAWSLTRVTAPVVGSTSTKKLENLISACHDLACVIRRWGFNFWLQMALISS